jgi:hypothetical protein
MGQVGQLSAEMVFDDKGFSATAAKLDGLVTLLRTDLSTLGESVQKVSEALAQSSQRMNTHNKTMSEGEAALRGFYREQRLQDRTMREARSSLLGFTVGLSALISGTGEGSEGVKKLEKVLLTSVTAMQAAEFSAAGIGIAGKGLGGTLGKVAGFLETNAGWIGAVVGVGAGLIAFFQDTNKEASKAAEEGLKKFGEGLSSIGIADQAQTAKNIDAKIKQLRAQSDALGRDKTVYKGDMEYTVRVLSPEDEKIIKANNGRIKVLQSLREKYKDVVKEAEELKKIEDEANGVLAKNQSRLQQISTQLENDVKQLKSGKTLDNERVLTSNQLLAIANDKVKLEAEQKKLTQSTKDIEEEQKKAAEDKKKKEEERYRLLQEQNKSMVSLDEYVKESSDSDEKALKAKTMTTAEFVAQQRIYQKQVGIGERYNELQIKISDALKQQTDEEKQQADEEKRSREHATDLAMAEYELGEKSRAQVIAELNAQMALTTDAIEQLRIKEKIRKLEDEELDQYARIAQLMSQAFTKDPDTFIAKLSQALIIAVQIAKYLKAAGDAKTTTMDSVESGLGIIGNIISLFSLKVGAGPTGATFDRPRMDLSWATSVQRRSEVALASVSRSARMIGSDGGDSASLIREIRALRIDISNNPPQVHLNNIVTMERALELKMPGYNRYTKNKFE